MNFPVASGQKIRTFSTFGWSFAKATAWSSGLAMHGFGASIPQSRQIVGVACAVQQFKPCFFMSEVRPFSASGSCAQSVSAKLRTNKKERIFFMAEKWGVKGER